MEIPAWAATCTWTGVNTNWNDALNWGGTVPGDGDAVVIPDVANDPVMPAGTYPATGAFLSFELASGAVLTCQGATNIVNEDSGGTVAIPHGIGVTINCEEAAINGSINASGGGFGGVMPVTVGPGCGTGMKFNGVSHGGLGANPKGVCYGSLSRPTALGSAGYQDSVEPYKRPKGGGAIRMTVSGMLTVNGSITANGLLCHNGSSAGSIWLQAGVLAGNGLVSAKGGATSSTLYYHGGGGGRIAVEYGTFNFTGTNTVACGGPIDGYNRGGQTGTVFMCHSPWLGTTTTNGVNGRRLDTRFSVSSNDVQIARVITRFDATLEWSDYSTDTSAMRVVTNQAVYTISGICPGSKYTISRDGADLFGKLLIGGDGLLVFTNTLDELHTFVVMPIAAGTVFLSR